MQGQRSSVGSLSETINFEHGSSSNNPGNQPVCWNNLWNPAENRIPDYLLPTSDINTGYVSSVSHEQRSLSRWSLGQPSYCDMQTEEALPDEQKAELGWSLVSPDADGPVSENRLCEPLNNPLLGHVNLSPLIIQNSNSNALPHSLNLNTSFGSHGGESSRVNEGSSVYKSSGSEEGRILRSSASDPLLLPSGNSGLPVVANDGRAGSSLDGRRVPCKRKAIEGSVTQSSFSGSSNYAQHIESGAVLPLPVFPGLYNNTGSRLTIPAPPARMNQAPVRGAGELTSNSFSEAIVAESSDSSQRNHRMRFSLSNSQDSFAPAGTTVRHPRASSSQLPARILPAEHVLDMRPAPAVDNISAQGQPIMIHVPGLPRSLHPYSRWNGSTSSRSGGSSSSAGDRQVMQREVRPSNMGRSVSEHPMFVPANELRNLVPNPSSRGLTSPNLPIPGNVASTSRVGSSSVVHSSSGPWMPLENSPTQISRRLTEYVRRQLFSSATNESGGRTSNYSQRSGSTSAQDMVLSSGSGRRGHHLLQPRSALLMELERRGDSGLGLPYSLRALPTSSEGSDNSRLLSEIRNVLGLVRRGESLRVEDVMILDQSLFYGMADIYDRHRDMRLDVDNMSYEELLALEERIGNVNTGLNEETIVARLKKRKHVKAAESQVDEEPCCVCQEEYVDGEDIGMLECGHDFHTNCIKQWLMQKNLCPICKTTGLGSRE